MSAEMKGALRLGRRDVVRLFATAVSGCLPTFALAARSPGSRRFHVSPDGADDQDGLAPDRAFRTVAAANALALQPGDAVLFQRGGVWRETLTLAASGAPNRPVGLGAFGVGDAPVISGADSLAATPLLAGGAAIDNAADDGRTRRWVSPVAGEPSQLFVDGQRGNRVASPAFLSAHRQWCYDATRKHVIVLGQPDGARPEIEASVRDHAFVARERADFVIDGLRFERGAWHTVLLEGCNRFRISGAVIADGFVSGLLASGERPSTDVDIRGCTIRGCGGSGILLGGNSHRWVIRENLIFDCCQLHDAVLGPQDKVRQLEWSGGIKAWGWGRAGLQGAVVVERNRVHHCLPADWAGPGSEPHKRGVGIWWDEVVAPRARQVISRNHVHDCQSRGIFLEKSDDCDVDYNLVHDCGQVPYAAGLAIQANAAGWDPVADRAADLPRDARNNRVRNNTVVGGWWALEISSRTDGAAVSGNQIVNTIAVNARHQNLYAAGGGSNDRRHGQDNVYSNNCFGSDGGRMAVWGGARCARRDELERVSASAVRNSVAGDPLFVDPARGNYELASASPCRGRGLETGLSMDRLGRTLPRPGAPDVGCHEEG
ncbi:right-handed parallel beta-helix repeat-containing protein [Roseomonas genomospecies 6]|uniref:Right-handed parallel beta-helix repeat-containing protein n=1 Tax=Roseomonas genomospecies 6 TaxID=214106 RepID=A0A9W7KQU1_9PROT|nr:right-handed parallel beta-helix repeat-containing protein [Roseomonas genomospecies 6]KAA0677960.1 right-handed parallel beta-helix repeat-containing protein [Roseomonas genomospecies 6]